MDGMLVHGERTMNGKRLLILAAFAVLATIVAPAVYAGTISNQANITVKWNTQAIGSMVLNSNYNATGGQLLTAPGIIQTQNSGGGTCSTNGVGSETADTVNFGNVTADTTKYTDCQYRNAVIATVTTSDPGGYSVTTQNITGALPSGYALCGLDNASANAAGGAAWANNGAVFQDNSGTATSIASLTCPTTDGWNVGSTTAQTLLAPTAATTGTNLGADYVLVVGPAATITNQETTGFQIQYTLTLQ
jgi:hypothetical protein